MSYRPWTPDELATLRRLTRKHMPVAAIAVQLDRSYNSVVHLRRRFHVSGRTWSRAENATLEQMLDEGYGYAEIGRKLRRTAVAVMLHAKARYAARTCTGATMSAVQVAALLGLGDHQAVTAWIGRGWLSATNATPDGPQCRWRITHEALWTFLSNPRYFMAWEPACIVDADLRAWAREERARHPRWLRTDEIAARCHVGQQTVRRYWIGSGALPAVRYGPAWWATEADLKHFLASQQQRMAP